MSQLLDEASQDDSQPRSGVAERIARYFGDRLCFETALSRTPGVETWRGEILPERHDVVITLVDIDLLSAVGRKHLEREAAVLADVNGQRLAPVVEAGIVDRTFYLLTRYIPGETLKSRLLRGPLDLRETLALGCCMLEGLGELHRHHLLHGNLRPSNVVLPDEPRVASATLIDFGPTAVVKRDRRQREQSVETAMYFSPEQAGALDHEVGVPADLYAAGLVLFECLAGHAPFTGPDVGGILLKHLSSPVPELRNLGLAVPRALDDLIQRLLRKDPSDRYQSAEAVLADLEEILAATTRGDCDPGLVIGSRDRRSTLVEPAFVARKDEIERLEAEIGRTRRGQGGVILLEGESGGGKSRLLQELAQRAARNRLRVLRGHGVEEVLQRPFRILSGVAADLAAAASDDPELAVRLRRHLAPHRDAIAKALPDLARLLQWRTTAPAAPEEFGEERTLRACMALLDAVGTEYSACLILLDDCQWADDLTCRLIQRWQTRPANARPQSQYTLLVAAFRSEEVAEGHVLRHSRPSAHLRLSPFGPQEIQRLAESMAGPLPADAIELVSRLAEGSPFMASAVLHGMVESRALVPEAHGWRVEPMAMATLQSSRRAAGLLSRRIELLPVPTVAVLRAGAILGKEFNAEAAVRLAGQSADATVEALEEARRRRLVWIEPDGNCTFVHDKIRSAMLEGLSPAERQEMHRRAASDLQNSAPQSIAELAYHFDAAGESTRALPYALQAAEQARSAHFLEAAEDQYRIAERGVSPTDRATRYWIAEGLGDVLLLRGRYDEAASRLEQAVPLADGRYAQARIRGKLAELAFKRGDMNGAVGEYEGALRLLGWSIPNHTLIVFLLLLWETLVQVLHTALPRVFAHRRRCEPPDADRLAMRLFSGLAHGCWYARSKSYSLWAHLRGLNLAERYPPTPELAHAYSEHAPAMTLVPLFNRALAYAEKSFEIRRALGDLWGQGQSLHYHGIVLYASGRFEESVDCCRKAIRLLERMGDIWQVHIARYQVAASLYHLGDLYGAAAEAEANYKSGIEVGDALASGINLDIWLRAAGKAVPHDIVQKEMRRKRPDVQGKAQVLLAEGIRLLECDDAVGAATVIEQAVAITHRAGVKNAYTIPCLAWLATARRCQAERLAHCTPHRRRQLLRQSLAAARRAIRASRLCANDLPHALREYGLALAMLGRVHRARRAFERGLNIAIRQKARYEYAQTLLALGRVERELGWPNAEQHLAEAETSLSRLSIAASSADSLESGADSPPTLSLADRFDTVIESGRRIAAALTKPAIYREVEAAAVKLLRGQRCVLLEIHEQGGQPKFVPVDPGTDGGYSRRLVLEALQRRRATSYTETSGENDDLAGDRSAICVPVYSRGRAVACLFVAHRQVRGLFGPEEERLGDFVATLAGAALENAEGFEQLERLNETLEERVAERTAAAEARALELAESNRELTRVAQELRETEEQLRVAVQAAETANRAKSRFLATMSHEIRTPMNGILGMVEVALNTPMTPQQRNHLAIIRQSAGTLLSLLNDILDFSKIEAGKMDIESITFAPRNVVEDAVGLLAVSAFQKGLDLLCRVAPEVPDEVIGDPHRLRQIIVNLIGNAIKFTEHGEVLVNVWLQRDSEGRVDVHFAVVDSGIGIPAAKRDCIFEAFRQTDSSMTRRFGGSGLGLAISSQLVSLMGGRIWVDTEEGSGSTFHFVLPFALPEGSRCERQTVARRGKAIVFSTKESSRRIYTEMLASLGLESATAGDPGEFEAHWKGSPGGRARIVLIDVRPTEESCRAVIEQLSHPAGSPCPPVILLVPPNHAADEEPGLRHCLTKPLRAAELEEAIGAALGDSIVPEQATTRSPEISNSRPLRILLAEDGPVNQVVAVGLLEPKGHMVKVVDNGRQAVEAVAQGRFDVILMDLEMPEMDGLAATAAIRGVERGTGKRVPIVAMTAHAVEGFREMCMAAGMDGYISKPIQPAELDRAIAAVTRPVVFPSQEGGSLQAAAADATLVG